jgi:hypothetical protein
MSATSSPWKPSRARQAVSRESDLAAGRLRLDRLAATAAAGLSSPALTRIPRETRKSRRHHPPLRSGPDGCVADRLRPVDRHRDRDGRGLEQPGRDDMAVTNAKNEDVTEQVLEIVQQALDGLWTAEEMTRKVEQITGGKIERG